MLGGRLECTIGGTWLGGGNPFQWEEELVVQF
ncbi:hypothetical protein A2U01_0078103, partial [Trifolium medium]|nr:hypothetical protein [Trifolium medium]